MFVIAKEHWRSVNEFRAHLAKHSPSVAPWAHGVVLHHTWSPTVAQWRGSASIDAMARFYESKGWDRGPHLYIAVGSRNPADDGIWQMTPLNLPGIHAGSANRWAWGIEVVGNYDPAPWTAGLADMVRDTTVALMNWRSIAISRQTLIGHREVPSPKSCPGTAINMDMVRKRFAEAQGMTWNQ